MHSVYATGDIYLPWRLQEDPGSGLFERSLTLPYEFASAYLVVAGALVAMRVLGSNRNR